MQIDGHENKSYDDADINTLAEIIANFIIVNILKVEKSSLSKATPTSRFCKEVKTDKMEVG